METELYARRGSCVVAGEGRKEDTREEGETPEGARAKPSGESLASYLAHTFSALTPHRK